MKSLFNNRKVEYVPIDSCFLYCCAQDLENKLKKVSTADILFHQNNVLSLVIPHDIRDKWEQSTKLATKFRNIAQDYRFSLLKYKSLNQENYRRRYSYVS